MATKLITREACDLSDHYRRDALKQIADWAKFSAAHLNEYAKDNASNPERRESFLNDSAEFRALAEAIDAVMGF